MNNFAVSSRSNFDCVITGSSTDCKQSTMNSAEVCCRVFFSVYGDCRSSRNSSTNCKFPRSLVFAVCKACKIFAVKFCSDYILWNCNIVCFSGFKNTVMWSKVNAVTFNTNHLVLYVDVFSSWNRNNFIGSLNCINPVSFSIVN